ncbi:MAG: alpha/beta fold hydrolase [Paracoccaceae bacterium]
MTLILLPGMMCDARLFQPQLEAIPDCTVITTTDRDTIHAMAQDVLAAAPDQFDLAGLSMGGIVAMEVARLAPTRVRKLALLDTNHRAETDAVRTARLPQINAVQNGRLIDVMRDEMKPRYLADSVHKQSILDLCMDMATDLGPAAFVTQSHALMTRPDQTETLKSLQYPALVLCGADDHLCPVQTHQIMADLIPQADLKIIDHAGHLPTLEQPSSTNAALLQWLKTT